MARKPKSHYKDPNRRSNWMQNEQVPARQLKAMRNKRFDSLMESGETEAEALARALEIIPKSR